MSGRRRLALFLTIGHSPRTDVLSEMKPWWECGPTRDRDLRIEEKGALDGLGEDDITALAPAPGARQLVSRLENGEEVRLDASAIERRVARIVAERGRETEPDFIVLLCTANFPRMDASCPLLEAGRIVDSAVKAFARTSSRIGILVPHPSQMEELRDRFEPSPISTSHASPYSGDRFERATSELAESDLIVMLCMGYDEAMRDRVASATRKPVLLARRLVASAVAQLL